MADMAPVSAADFRSRVLAQQEKVRLEEAQEASKVYSVSPYLTQVHTSQINLSPHALYNIDASSLTDQTCFTLGAV